MGGQAVRRAQIKRLATEVDLLRRRLAAAEGARAAISARDVALRLAARAP
jgi:hypothetical protein